MARKQVSSRAAAPSNAKASGRSPSLAKLRSEIDQIDQGLVELLNRRAELAAQIGQIKQAEGLDVYSPAREEEVLQRVVASSKGPLLPETIRLIFRELMSGSRAIQRSIRVAFLGPLYSYSHLAAVAKFGHAVEHVPVGSISAVFEEVNRRHVQFGIVPLENSTDGRIADTLEMFARMPNLKIKAEVKLRIHHYLLGHCQWGQIQRVYSKAQALSQCRNWLGKNLPEARLVDVVSTAAAAELAAREDFGAAVASLAAADAHNLKIMAERIEDRPNNHTRFAVISEQAECRTGRDKTTVMVRLPNQPGALARAIEPLAKLAVNMTWIESFPAHDPAVESDRDPVYVFFLDIEGHSTDEQVQKALDAVRKRVERLDVLGSYPRTMIVEG